MCQLIAYSDIEHAQHVLLLNWLSTCWKKVCAKICFYWKLTKKYFGTNRFGSLEQSYCQNADTIFQKSWLNFNYLSFVKIVMSTEICDKITHINSSVLIFVPLLCYAMGPVYFCTYFAIFCHIIVTNVRRLGTEYTNTWIFRQAHTHTHISTSFYY